jgi:HlyD family secretion protein
MTNANDLGRTLAAARNDSPHPDGNGPATLSDRVRSLRLKDQTQNAGGGGKSSALPWALCVVLLLVTAAVGYRAYRLAPAGDAKPADSAANSPGTSSFTSDVAKSGDVVLEQKGYIIPAHQIMVSPKITGMVVWLHERFMEGQKFKKGDVLAVLEDVDYKADRDHSEAALAAAQKRYVELKERLPLELAQAEAKLAETEANLTQLKLEADRNIKLVATSSTAQRDYEIAKYAYDAMVNTAKNLRLEVKLRKETLQAKLDAAAADVKSAQADLDKAQWRLDNCQILAPVDGTILRKKAEKGNLVIPSAFASDNGLSASLCDMADLADLEVELDVQERDVAALQDGQPCTVMPEAFQNHAPFRKLHPDGYKGKLSRQMPIANRSKGAITVRVAIEVPKEEEGVYLKPDMGVIVSFKRAEKDKQ